VRRSLAFVVLASTLGCTYTRYVVRVDDPAVVRVVPVPPDSFVDRASDGALSLHWEQHVGRSREAKVTPIVDAEGHVAPRPSLFVSESIVFPIGQVALPRHICVEPGGKHCRESYAFEIVAPLDHVREIRQVTRFDPFLAGWLVFGGVVSGVGAAGAFTSNWDPRAALGGGVALSIASAAAIALGLYLLFAPPSTTVLYAP
jgi:hypothetical protein